MSKTMVLHVRYNSISAAICTFLCRRLQNNNVTRPILRCLENVNYDFLYFKFYFKFIAVSQIQFRDSFHSDKQSKWLKSIPRFVGKI